jgi:hypothetical protein
MDFFQSSKFFTVAPIITIANIITIINMHPLVIIGCQVYEFGRKFGKCTELFQHLPRGEEKIHENLSGRSISDSTLTRSKMAGQPSPAYCNRENSNKTWRSNFIALSLSVIDTRKNYYF